MVCGPTLTIFRINQFLNPSLGIHHSESIQILNPSISDSIISVSIHRSESIDCRRHAPQTRDGALIPFDRRTAAYGCGVRRQWRSPPRRQWRSRLHRLGASRLHGYTDTPNVVYPHHDHTTAPPLPITATPTRLHGYTATHRLGYIMTTPPRRHCRSRLHRLGASRLHGYTDSARCGQNVGTTQKVGGYKAECDSPTGYQLLWCALFDRHRPSSMRDNRA